MRHCVSRILLMLAQAIALMWVAIAVDADSQSTHTLDWVPLAQLTDAQRQALPYGSCGAYIAPIRTDIDANISPGMATTHLEADQATLKETADQQDMLLVGDVLVTQGHRQLQAQRVRIHQPIDLSSTSHAETTDALTLLAEDQLVVREPGLLLLGSQAHIDQQNNRLTLEEARYVLHRSGIRGAAQHITQQNERRGEASGDITLTRANLTRCEPGNNTWQLRGSQIVLDMDARQGYAKHVRLLVKGIPLLYWPYLRFPLGSGRQSGFLFPSFAYGSEGMEVAVPYYFNLAPHYDLLYTPQYLEQHGLLHEAAFRHLSHHFRSRLQGAYLWADKGGLTRNERNLVATGNITAAEAAPFKGDDRWLFHFDQQGRGVFSPSTSWSSHIDYSQLSDRDYVADFGAQGMAEDSDSHLDQTLSLRYQRPHWQLATAVTRYQMLSNATEPYQSLPALSLDGEYQWMGALDNSWQLHLHHEWIRFDHEEASKLTGNRLRADYALGWAMEPAWGFLRPRVQLKHLHYQLRDNAFVAGVDSSPHLTAPQFILDTGIYLERDTPGYRQTLEPRLFYFRSAFRDHSPLFDLTQDGQDIDFDTADLSFSYSQLFRETRFSGGDRIDDANQLAMGFTTRFIGNQSGLEWLSLSAGQIRYFDHRRVTLNNQPDDAAYSPWALRIASEPLSGLNLSSDMRYDQKTGALDQSAVKIRYQSPANHMAEVNYRFTRGDLTAEETRQMDASLVVPLFHPRWHLLMHTHYDVTQSRELETLGAIEYNGCCYRLRAGYQAEIDETRWQATGETNHDHRFFFEIHFKGLGGAGKQLDTLLTDKVSGYPVWQATHHTSIPTDP